MKRFVLACVMLIVLSVQESATAQILPPVVDPPTTIQQPPVGYPPTTAPTVVGPYYASPAWDQTLAGNVRFVILANFAHDAVLDRETGLVWARQSAPTPYDPSSRQMIWFGADLACRNLIVGSRGGWRLPTVAELRSLVDYSIPESSEPRFPVGHPFVLSPITIAAGTFYRFWTSEPSPYNTFDIFNVWSVVLESGQTTTASGSSNQQGALCVRGRQ